MTVSETFPEHIPEYIPDNAKLRSALALVQRGWGVVPTDGRKAPLNAGGSRAALTTPKEVRDFWQAHPEANPAVTPSKPKVTTTVWPTYWLISPTKKADNWRGEGRERPYTLYRTRRHVEAETSLYVCLTLSRPRSPVTDGTAIVATTHDCIRLENSGGVRSGPTLRRTVSSCQP